MRNTFVASDVMELSVAERIELVEDIWDSISKIPESVELTLEQKEILNRRLKKYHNNTDAGSPWSEVAKRIKERK